MRTSRKPDRPPLQILIQAVQIVLTPELLAPRWRRLLAPGAHFTAGHCYVAAEALWHLLGCRGWQPMVASYTNNGVACTHWWLQSASERADPTEEQFWPAPPPYHLGRRAGFLTKKPSKHAKEVMRRARPILKDLLILSS